MMSAGVLLDVRAEKNDLLRTYMCKCGADEDCSNIVHHSDESAGDEGEY